MKILCPVYNFFGSGTNGISGGEVYLYNLIKYLQTQGHEFRMITGSQVEYEYEGIKCYPQGQGGHIWLTNNEHFKWCDIVLTQLLGCAYACNKVTQHQKHLIFIAHNNATSYPVKWSENLHIIYNSYQAREDLQQTYGDRDCIVLHPIINPYKKGNGRKITLINCSHNKGGHILGQIAERLPQLEFMGVFGGYQDQIECHLPNITYLPNGTDMNQVYEQTRILLCPSEFESYSQCAAEALTAGIPVIAHPTPGLRENLSYAGIFINRTDINKYVETLLYLNSESAYAEQSQNCLRRAQACRIMNDQELINVNNWINKIK